MLFLPEVSKQFVELAEILYDKGYMSFLDTALEYSESLFRDIQSDLPIRVHRKAPAGFDICNMHRFLRISIRLGTSFSTCTMLAARLSTLFAI